MAIITIEINDTALEVLQRRAAVEASSVEELAALAVEAEAITHLPGGMQNMRFGENTRRFTGYR